MKTQIARRFIAGLSNQLAEKMQNLLSKPIDAATGADIAAWLETHFAFWGAKTPQGGKILKEDLNRLHWWLKHGVQTYTNQETVRTTLEDAWTKVQSQLDMAVKLFTEEGGQTVPREIRVGQNTYLNLSGFSETAVTKYSTAIEHVFDELKGWRKKALSGGLKIALAGPKDFWGTSSGKYKTESDTLYVRATPQILQRTRGTYAAFDYIIVHELGHRYALKQNVHVDFDSPQWWTSRYSHIEGEAFSELFAISNFGLAGPWDQSVVERFDRLMS